MEQPGGRKRTPAIENSKNLPYKQWKIGNEGVFWKKGQVEGWETWLDSEAATVRQLDS